MQIFLIHRFSSRKAAISLLKDIATKEKIDLKPIILDSSGCDTWKLTAQAGINECEAVVVFDMAACKESKNAIWEIDQAQELNKPLITIDPSSIENSEIKKLCSLYHNDEEFHSCFKKYGEDTESLYKMMVDSSEQLIQRRQRMSAFFITVIGSLLAFASTLAKFGTDKSPTISFLVIGVFGIIGLFLCNSWRNLIDNYGKLNAAKFRVILELEKSLSAQIFSAEWIALGKGLRPRKYQSFTTTESNVPLWFAILIFILIILAILWHIGLC